MTGAAFRFGATFAALGLLLAGCAFSPALQRVAVDHNKMVAEAEDELTLLNIVRAAHRFPLHFTTVTQVNGNAELALNGELEVGLGDVPDPELSILGAGIVTNPSFQASVLATDEFQRGIQAPISPELVAYYLDEGWRDELIMALFVERVEIAGASASAAIINNPSADGGFAQLLCTHELVTRPTSASRPLARFEDLIDLSIVKSRDSSANDRRKEIEAFLALSRREGVQLTGDVLMLQGSNNSVELTARKESRCEGVSAARDTVSYQPRFRSTLGAIYFLGEYLREMEELGESNVYKLPSCFETCEPGNFVERPLIAIHAGDGEELIATRFRGQRYFVSADEDRRLLSDRGDKPRTLQVIAILQQLVNLQKSGDALPQSISITALN